MFHWYKSTIVENNIYINVFIKNLSQLKAIVE